MGSDQGNIRAAVTSHVETRKAETPDQCRRHEANHCGDEKALAVSESGESATRRCHEDRPEEGHCQEGGKEEDGPGCCKGGDGSCWLKGKGMGTEGGLKPEVRQ